MLPPDGWHLEATLYSRASPVRPHRTEQLHAGNGSDPGSNTSSSGSSGSGIVTGSGGNSSGSGSGGGSFGSGSAINSIVAGRRVRLLNRGLVENGRFTVRDVHLSKAPSFGRRHVPVRRGRSNPSPLRQNARLTNAAGRRFAVRIARPCPA